MGGSQPQGQSRKGGGASEDGVVAAARGAGGCGVSRTSYFATLLLLFSPMRGLAQDTTHHLAEYTFRSWTSRDGLANATVQDLAQTPDGYLWIATLEGLVR